MPEGSVYSTAQLNRLDQAKDSGRVDFSPVTLLERMERSITTLAEEEDDGSHGHG